MKLPPDLEAKCLELAGVKPEPRARKSAGRTNRPGPGMVAAWFSPPGTWLIPHLLEPLVNGGAFKKGVLGRSAADRRAVSRAFAPRLRDLAPFADAALAGGPVVCRITRLGGGEMDDDNLPVSAKYVRDAVALWLGVDDAPGGPVRWKYGQQPGGSCGVMIKLELPEAK